MSEKKTNYDNQLKHTHSKTQIVTNNMYTQIQLLFFFSPIIFSFFCFCVLTFHHTFRVVAAVVSFQGTFFFERQFVFVANTSVFRVLMSFSFVRIFLKVGSFFSCRNLTSCFAKSKNQKIAKRMEQMKVGVI